MILALPSFSVGPWLECGKGICFASRQIAGSTPAGSTIFFQCRVPIVGRIDLTVNQVPALVNTEGPNPSPATNFKDSWLSCRESFLLTYLHYLGIMDSMKSKKYVEKWIPIELLKTKNLEQMAEAHDKKLMFSQLLGLAVGNELLLSVDGYDRHAIIFPGILEVTIRRTAEKREKYITTNELTPSIYPKVVRCKCNNAKVSLIFNPAPLTDCSWEVPTIIEIGAYWSDTHGIGSDIFLNCDMTTMVKRKFSASTKNFPKETRWSFRTRMTILDHLNEMISRVLYFRASSRFQSGETEKSKENC